jgi:biotin carboxyl carrier protein
MRCVKQVGDGQEKTELPPVSGHFSASSPSTLIAQVMNRSYNASIAFNPTITASSSTSSDIDVFLHGQQYRFAFPRLSFSRGAVTASSCVSPMAGRVVKVLAKAGDNVQRGSVLETERGKT